MRYSKYRDADESPGLLFWQVSVLWQRKIKEALRPYGITHTQFVILAVTHEMNEHIPDVTQNEISGYSMIDVMTVSTALRLLEKKGLVVRESHPTDTRAKRVTNTEQGDSILKEVNPVVESVDEEFFFDAVEKTDSFMKLLRQLKNANAVRN
jgi:DNA-binding MarR family transcriptional regulator